MAVESTWTVLRYQILQVLPADGYQAVFAEEEADGTCTLRADPPDFLALVAVKEVEFRGIRGEQGRKAAVRRLGNDVVPLSLTDCGFSVGAKAYNFAGLKKTAEPLWAATYALPWHYKSKLRPEFKEPAGEQDAG